MFAAEAPAALGTIRLSSVGFRPSSMKTATFLQGGRFTVRRTADGTAVFSAALDRAVNDAVTARTVYIGDFSAVRSEGSYYLELSNCERSPDFSISRDVYLSAFKTMMLGFYGQRCGTSVSLSYGGADFGHAACHTAGIDLSSFDGTGQPSVLVGGWHDAGDYGRYTVNAAFTLGTLLRAWEDYSADLGPIALAIPETGGSTPDFLAEARWEIEWLLQMEYADGSGRFANEVNSQTYPPFVMPEDDTSPIALASTSSMATAASAAVLAQAARVFRPTDATFADRCESAALRAYGWLTSQPTLVLPSERWAAGYTYGSDPGDATSQSLDASARIWAAAEIWVTTGSASALLDFETRVQAASYAFNSAPDWFDPGDLGVISYLRTDSALQSAGAVDALSQSVLGAAAALRSAHDAADNGWGRAQGYWWGANGTTARSCLVLQMAQRLDSTGNWMDLCAEQIGTLLGRNPYGRSQVTGIGVDPPMHPHHRPSGADGVVPPWPGLLVGGPQQNGGAWTDWTDNQDDYFTNETAINWNAALVVALAGFLGDDPVTPATDGGSNDELDASTPTCVPDDAGDGATTDAPSGDSTTTDAPSGDGATTDGGLGDAGTSTSTVAGGGCSCRLGVGGARANAWTLAGVALLLVLQRRRRESSGTRSSSIEHWRP